MIPRLKMLGVQKRFGATHALRGVDLEVRPGEIHALIGENGAGKSTLMKVLSGAIRSDEGRIELDGQPFVPSDPLHARRHGVAMMYQELNLAPHLSVEENILLGESRRCGDVAGFLNKRRRRELARQALATLQHESLPLDAPVYTRGIAEQQIVEIARVLIAEPLLLIMDEPTSSLTQVDTENLFAILGRLRARGVSIIYISHFLEECRRICDRYTVLRDGRTVATGDMRAAELPEIIRHMVGREIREIYPRLPHSLGQPVLEVRNLSGRMKPRRLSFNLRAGEIFGIAGLIGAGRTETVRACFGLDRLAEGEIVVMGRNSTHADPCHRLREGIGLVSENRKEEGLLLDRSIADNLTLTRLRPFSTCGLVSGRKQREAANDWIERLSIRAASPDQLARELSGGNQQKVAVARLLHHDAKILLLDEPTRGIDVGSKAQIYQWIGELAQEGRAILFVSSYIPELLGVCDTIGVMHRGVLADIRPAAEWDEHSIVAAAVGQTEAP
jgi:ribose transport system ATP-binding protein